MVDHRLLLITPQGQVVINHPDQGEIGFSTIAECTAITGVDLGNTRAVNYEPDNGFYIDADKPHINLDHAPNLIYESMIDNVALYRQRKEG